ncbi:MAG: PAS domain-containing protein [Devosia sp.]
MPKSLFPAATPETRARLEDNPTLKLTNDYDWSANPLGPITAWPESLKGAVRVMMAASTPMAMLIGEQGILIYNDAYARFAGRRHPQIFGMSAIDAWPEAAEFNAEMIKRCMAGETTTLKDQEMLLNRHGQPEATWMDLHYSPVLGEDGQPLAGICFLLDTTDQILAKAALARSEERLSLALSSSGLVGTWDWDVANDVVTADDRFADLFNLDPMRAGLGVTMKEFLSAIYADDALRIGEDIAAAIREKSALRSEYRVMDSSGAIRWVAASGRPRFSPEGAIQRFPGVLVDITDQRRTTAALAESELRFRTLADAMPQMVWTTLPDGYHDYYNARWYEFTGVPVGSTDGEAWNGMFHPDDQDRAWATWKTSLATGEPYEIEYRLRHHSGTYRWALGLALPMRDPTGTIVRWIGTCTDIHAAKLAAEERELVAQELSHRIKNIFAVLTGIISLSARGRPEIKTFADELRQRIYALGEAHDFVRPHSQGSAPVGSQSSLRDLIERLMRPYQTPEFVRVEFSGDDAIIDDGAATPLALLFHELATNAAKYGALSVGTGRIMLQGQRGDDNRYRLTWKELGGPPATPGHLSGFGSRVIELSVQGQLRGELERHWDADGLRVEVDLPGDALTRSARLSRGS